MSDPHDISVARDIGSLQADMRTVKHDTAQISAKMDGLSAQISKMNNQRERGLGFIAGASFIIASFGALLTILAKLLFGGHGA